ncbi:MAG: hypothetical protein EBT57_06355, partial [Verrucomicrobia bacterium]|nr:hypothetical protein [Verrucomicrobiota bacterium]
NKILKRSTLAFCIGAMVASAWSDSSNDSVSAKETKKLVQNNFVETAQKELVLSGYVDMGYSYNFNSTGQSQVWPRFAEDTAQYGDFNLYAVKLALEKPLSDENRAQAGFRTDIMVGEDANYLANRSGDGDGAFENNEQNSNGLFIEQAYAQFRIPVGNGWDWKVGKFVAILGFEANERPSNMNTTFGLLWQQFPVYYLGVLTTYSFDEYLTGQIGVVNGANTDNNLNTSGNGDGCALIADLSVKNPGGNAQWMHNFQYSSNPESDSVYDPAATSLYVEGNTGLTGGGAYTFIYESWGTWAPKFADDKLLLAFDTVLGTSNGGQYGGTNTTWYGVASYAKYQFNDWFHLASRGEYLGGNNLGKVGALTDNQDPAQYLTADQTLNHPLSWWEYTITAGFNLAENTLLRGEFRVDWGNYTTGPNLGTGQPGTIMGSGASYYAGAEIIYSF